jgi:hypothetical protein
VLDVSPREIPERFLDVLTLLLQKEKFSTLRNILELVPADWIQEIPEYNSSDDSTIVVTGPSAFESMDNFLTWAIMKRNWPAIRLVENRCPSAIPIFFSRTSTLKPESVTSEFVKGVVNGRLILTTQQLWDRFDLQMTAAFMESADSLSRSNILSDIVSDKMSAELIKSLTSQVFDRVAEHNNVKRNILVLDNLLRQCIESRQCGNEWIFSRILTLAQMKLPESSEMTPEMVLQMIRNQISLMFEKYKIDQVRFVQRV